MSKHTPGPWTFKGRTVRGPHPRDPEGRTRIVANAIWGRGTYVGEAEANARLIAAAPEVLEALEELFYLIDGAHDGERVFTFKMQRKAKAAIAKAKGE